MSSNRNPQSGIPKPGSGIPAPSRAAGLRKQATSTAATSRIQPKQVEPKLVQQDPSLLLTSAPKIAESKPIEPKLDEAQPIEPKPVEHKQADIIDSKPSKPKTSDELIKTDPPAPLEQVAKPSSGSANDCPSDWVELEAKYKQDIEALTESAEMATIEKEIAEEKLDSCERELQETKDKLAEAMLQAEMAAKEPPEANVSGSESTAAIHQLQKVEEQNERLRQALIKLRDMSEKDREELQNLQIQHEEVQEKLLDFEEKEQKYLEQIKIYEEQIDVSQSAQEMVEKLTQQKTELEDKLRDMVEEFDGMEKLYDLNEQILENARENEIELTGELDKLKVQHSELIKRKRDLEDYLLDQERTVSQLRDQNRELSDQVTLLRDRFKEGESIEQQKHQIENVAYKLNFNESKMAEKESEIARYKRNLADMEEQMNNLSLITKEQSAQLDELKSQLDAKTSENADLQRALKKKIEDVSELEIRRDMAEKKLAALQRDSESKVTNLSRTIETMRGIEVQHEEEIKRLMEDNEIIERERRLLRDQLNKSTRSLERSVMSSSMVTAHDASLASLGITFQGSPIHEQAKSSQTSHGQLAALAPGGGVGGAAGGGCQQYHSSQSQSSSIGGNTSAGAHSASDHQDESIFVSKARDLSSAFKLVKRRNFELELELAMRELNAKIDTNSLLPPSSTTTTTTTSERQQQQADILNRQSVGVGRDSGAASIRSQYDLSRVRRLRQEAEKLKREVQASIINQKICTKSRQVQSQARNDQFARAMLARRYQVLENETSALLSSSVLARSRPLGAAVLHSTPVK